MLDTKWPLWLNVTVFLFAALVIALAGTRLASTADRIADRTGLGEALTGTFFLGLITALPGIAASVTAALADRPAMAISNAIGGIAIQTVFLAGADIVYRKANLEHAAASAANMVQGAGLIFLLTLVMLGLSSPDATVADVHPVTLLLFFAAAGAVWLTWQAKEAPMWSPRRTGLTVEDKPEKGAERENLWLLLTEFLITALAVIAAGTGAATAADGLVEQTGVSESVAGGLFLAIATSLPELITTIAAVRRGALTLAVSNIVGGNFFDVLFVCFADIAYFSGSIYHAPAVGMREIFVTALAILLNAILLAGLLFRQKRGIANIGFESFLMILAYLAGFIVMWVFM